MHNLEPIKTMVRAVFGPDTYWFADAAQIITGCMPGHTARVLVDVLADFDDEDNSLEITAWEKAYLLPEVSVQLGAKQKVLNCYGPCDAAPALNGDYWGIYKLAEGSTTTFTGGILGKGAYIQDAWEDAAKRVHVNALGYDVYHVYNEGWHTLDESDGGEVTKCRDTAEEAWQDAYDFLNIKSTPKEQESKQEVERKEVWAVIHLLGYGDAVGADKEFDTLEEAHKYAAQPSPLVRNIMHRVVTSGVVFTYQSDRIET